MSEKSLTNILTETPVNTELYSVDSCLDKYPVRNPIKRIYNRIKSKINRYKNRGAEEDTKYELSNKIKENLKEIERIAEIEKWAKDNVKSLKEYNLNIESSYQILWQFKYHGVDNIEFIKQVVEEDLYKNEGDGGRIFAKFSKKPDWYGEEMIKKIANSTNIYSTLKGELKKQISKGDEELIINTISIMSDKERLKYLKNDKRRKELIDRLLIVKRAIYDLSRVTPPVDYE